MSLTSRFKRAFRLPFRNVEREIDDELSFHIEQKIQELIESGMEPAAAYREARRRFGDVTAIHRESSRIQRRITKRVERRETIGSFVRDIRFAVRTLRKNPGFAAVAILTIGLGIGATTAIFSVVDGVLLKPLPYPESDRLVRIYQQNSSNRWGLSVADYQAIEAQQNSFDGVAAVIYRNATLTGAEEPRLVRAGFVTADWFATFGVHPTEGRGFRTGEDQPGSELVAVVSYAFRERHFGSESDPLGRGVMLDGRRYTVVGVLPRGVQSLGSWHADVWPILQPQPPTRRGPFFIRSVARLRNGLSLDEAGLDLSRISENIFPRWADGFTDREARLTPYPLKDAMIGDVGSGIVLLFGAVGLVLMIAVANVANLMLARASVREREMALRTSLGASKSRLARQLLVESTVLASLGGAVGVALSFAALNVLVAIGPQLPRLHEVRVDARVLGFTALITIASGMLFGLAPLLQALARDSAASLRSGGRGASAGKKANTLRGALVTAEFALALPLLAGAALLFTSLARLQRVDAGFDPDNLLLATISMPTSTYPTAPSVMQLWDQALANIRTMPGVDAVAISSGLPPNDAMNFNNFDLLDKPVQAGGPQPVVPWLAVVPDFFSTMRIPLLRGRLLNASDTRDAPPVLTVSESWAARFYTDQQVLGKQLYEGGDTSTPWTIVGVVGDVKYSGLESLDDAAVYASYPQYTWRPVNLIVRTRGGAVTMAQLEKQIHALDPNLPLADVQTMRDKLAASVARPRYWTGLLGVFATVGIVLAAVGIYGVLSHFVSQQTRDIGVRMALGADASSVRRMVVRRGMGQVVLGLVAGLGGAMFLTRWIGSLLFDVSPTDPITFIGVSLFLLLVALAACYLPARRATNVDPVQALTAE